MENPSRMDDLGVPLFLETPTHIEYMWLDAMWVAAKLFIIFWDMVWIPLDCAPIQW